MIQFNLLPDVKQKYIKTQRTKRTVMLGSIVAIGVSLALVTTLFVTVQILQKKHIEDVSKDIASQVKSLNDIEDLNKILTIQNQLNSLPDLHSKKPVVSRTFGYVQQFTPVLANISKMDVDFDNNTMNITGTADSLVTVNKFADTLKFATYTNTTTDKGKPFSNVVTTISRDDKKASFVLTFNFDPILFDSTQAPTLVVPKIISTRSETEKPAAVFKEAPAPTKTGGTQ